MITSRHIHAAEAVVHQIFSYFACHAIEVSRIVVLVKYIIGELELIAAKKTQLKSHQVLQVNAQGQQRKEIDVKTKLPIQMGVVICIEFTKHFKRYEKDTLVRDRYQC
jgi:hypothetical protein